jgi:hypothetical protein
MFNNTRVEWEKVLSSVFHDSMTSVDSVNEDYVALFQDDYGLEASLSIDYGDEFIDELDNVSTVDSIRIR